MYYDDVFQIPIVKQTLGYTGIFEVGAAMACIGMFTKNHMPH